MKPIRTFRAGAIGASVWERTGKNGSFCEFTLSRSYKNKDGESAYSGSFRDYDAENIKAVLDGAIEYIRSRDGGQGQEVVKPSEPAEAADRERSTTAAAEFSSEGL